MSDYIYIVEDHGTLNQLLARQVERVLQMRVAQATRAEFAYPALSRPPAPAIVLSDFQLAGREDGADLAAWMLTQPHLASTRRILITGTPREQIRLAVRRCGYVHMTDLWHVVVEKPASASDVMAVVVPELAIYAAAVGSSAQVT
ncbi:hypothetical protein K2Z83_26100 [Oscillochloris sp. ZM17-4]|uniref:hypothetical protein n=1 Tax=Oscillochloris sp. ZM17-4 TaxID=2866714 RepID=UPI001C73AA06|nr:hypothetical protein [Oscillochloris sp. ZM17-4]MBX0331126.1 hypothetical protein [Oscillochloris sp. ZM17-4]